MAGFPTSTIPAPSSTGQVLTSTGSTSGAFSWQAASSGSLTLIQRIVAPGNTTSVTFSAIPQTYENLVLVFNAGSSSGNDNLNIQFNGDATAAHYTGQVIRLSGTTVAGFNSTVNQVAYLTNPAPEAAAGQILIPAYARTDHKYAISHAATPNAGILTYFAVDWASIAAITSVSLLEGSAANLTADSVFSLYGQS